MKLIDITRTIQEAPLYPGSQPFSLSPLTTIDATEEFNITILHGDSHLGTHLDAPKHALANGAAIEQTELSLYYGDCYVLSVPEQTLLSAQFFQQPLPANCSRLLLKSNGTSYLSLEAAYYLAEKKLLLLGTDSLSPASSQQEGIIHRLFLQQGTALLENLLLQHVPDGRYTLCAFPLKIQHGDGSPVRAVLLSDY